MTNLKRYGDLQIVSVYNTVEKLATLKNEWAKYVKKGQVFCPSGACPFVPGDRFDYDLSNFLYYRARAITSDITNLNGDLFPHEEVKPSFETFVGKGIYFNHDSESADKAFGIILDAMYTPTLYNDEKYADKYVEILGAIDRNAAREKRPGLLEDIESGKVTSTSMGTIARKAKCSICGNMAVNMETLCDCCHPQSPMYMKGRTINGKLCYETNYGLTFIEDSIVYVPADPTAHMLEVYASKHPEYIDRLAEIFLKYSKALGRNIANSKIELTSHFKNTGGLIMEKTAATTEFKHTKDPAQHLVAPYQESVKELDEEVTDSAAKTLDSKIRRLIEEEFRKALAPLLEHMDRVLRPIVKEKVTVETNKVKDEVGAVLPGGVPAVEKAMSEAPAAKAEPVQQPAAGQAKPAPALAPAAASLHITAESIEEMLESIYTKLISGIESISSGQLVSTDPTSAFYNMTKEDALNRLKSALPVKTSVVKLAYIEDFSKWKSEEKEKLIKAVSSNSNFEFSGVLELPESHTDPK